MPRFSVTAADLHTEEICGFIKQAESPSDAICAHPWFTEIYRPEWVQENIGAPDAESVISNCKQRLNWLVLCVNLDEEIMKDLNGGDSSVSCSTQLS